MDGWKDDSTADCFWESHPSESRTWQNPLLKVFCLRFLLDQEPRTIFKAKIKNYLPKNQYPLDQEPRTTWSRTRTVSTKNQGLSQPRTKDHLIKNKDRPNQEPKSTGSRTRTFDLWPIDQKPIVKEPRTKNHKKQEAITLDQKPKTTWPWTTWPNS